MPLLDALKSRDYTRLINVGQVTNNAQCLLARLHFRNTLLQAKKMIHNKFSVQKIISSGFIFNTMFYEISYSAVVYFNYNIALTFDKYLCINTIKNYAKIGIGQWWANFWIN